MQHHGRASSHRPELILNNFGTRLGHRLGRMFASIFRQDQDFKGRRAVTFHNQRDFIFFRSVHDLMLTLHECADTRQLRLCRVIFSSHSHWLSVQLVMRRHCWQQLLTDTAVVQQHALCGNLLLDDAVDFCCRHHRYIFEAAERRGPGEKEKSRRVIARLQELGPRFTLKLLSLQKGTFDSKGGEYEWVHNHKSMDTSRRCFFL